MVAWFWIFANLSLVPMVFSIDTQVINAAVSYLAKTRDTNCLISIDIPPTLDKDLTPMMPVVYLANLTDDNMLEASFKFCNNIIIYVGPEAKIVARFQHVLRPSFFYVFVCQNSTALFRNPILKRYLNSVIISEETKATVWMRSGPFSSSYTKANDEKPRSRSRALNFDKHPFRASAFPFSPYTELDFETGNHGGFEYKIAAAAAQSLNLNMTVSLPHQDWWGYENPPGSGNYTGVQGDLQFDRADIAWGNLFMTEDRMAFMDFTQWHSRESFCVLVHRPSFYPKVRALIMPFDTLTWIGVIVTLIITFAFYWLLGMVYKSRNDSLSLFLVGATLRQSSALANSYKSDGFRVATGIFFLSSLILAFSYSSSLISVLTVKVSPPPINTFDQLIQKVRRDGLIVTYCCLAQIEGLENSLVPSYQELGRVAQDHNSNKKAIEQVKFGTHATINTRSVLEFGRRRYLTDSNGEARGHIMNECYMTVQIAHGIQKQSPFKEALDHKMQQLREAGLVTKWIEDGANQIARMKFTSIDTSEGDPLSLEELQGILIFYPILVLSALVIFIVEICSTKVKVKLKSKTRAKIGTWFKK